MSQKAKHHQPSQEDQVLRHLEKGHTITPLAALRLYGIHRLGARIHQLREDGHHIETEMISVISGPANRKRTARVARYRLVN